MQIMTAAKAFVAEELKVGEFVLIGEGEATIEGRVVSVDEKYYRIELGSPEQIEAWKKEKADGQQDDG